MKIDRLDVMLSFRATTSEHKQIKEIAEQEERRLADVIRRIFRRGLALEKKR